MRLRNFLCKELETCGIETRPFFIPMHRLPIHRRMISLPVCEDLAKRGVSLPCFVQIKDEQIEYVCSQIKRILNGQREE